MPPRVLVMGPSWVGDMVLAQSLFKTIKSRQPDAYLAVASPNWTLPLLERMEEVDDTIALPFQHGQLALGERIRYGRQLKEHRFTQAILLTNSLKSAILPWAAGIPRRTGFLGEWRYGLLNDIRPLDRKRLPRTVDRFVALGLDKGDALPPSLPIPGLRAGHEHALYVLQGLGHMPPHRPVLGLCPGAEYGEAKRWPAEHYAEVAKHFLAQDWEVWLFGSHKDVAVTSKINALTRARCLDLGGRTSLADAIDLMSLTTAVVSNDSGLMHIAAALDKPLVAVYGSSDPHHTPPMNSKAAIAYLGLPCSPCFKRECPLGHLNCLNGIKPLDILRNIQAVSSMQEKTIHD